MYPMERRRAENAASHSVRFSVCGAERPKMMDANQPIPSTLAMEDPSCAHIVGEFLASLDERLHELEASLQEGNLDGLRAKAHQLKGAGGSYGYPALTERAAELEAQAKAGNLERCRGSFASLKTLCGQLVVGVEA